MRRERLDQRLQRAREGTRLLGRPVETEELDGDDAIAAGVDGTEHGAEDAASDLMEDAVRPDALGRGDGTRIVVAQWVAPGLRRARASAGTEYTLRKKGVVRLFRVLQRSLDTRLAP